MRKPRSLEDLSFERRSLEGLLQEERLISEDLNHEDRSVEDLSFERRSLEGLLQEERPLEDPCILLRMISENLHHEEATIT